GQQLDERGGGFGRPCLRLAVVAVLHSQILPYPRGASPMVALGACGMAMPQPTVFAGPWAWSAAVLSLIPLAWRVRIHRDYSPQTARHDEASGKSEPQHSPDAGEKKVGPE